VVGLFDDPLVDVDRAVEIVGKPEFVAADYGEIVDSAAAADLAVIRLSAPFEKRDTPFENFFHAGSLDFDVDTIRHVNSIASAVPTVIDVFLDRPAILEPLLRGHAALVVNFGANDRALLDVLFGKAAARGRLPFDLPASMDAVAASRPDTPFDTSAPIYRFGHGHTLSET